VKQRNLTYLVILIVAISSISVYARATSLSGNILLKEHVSSLNQHQKVNSGDFIKSIALDRSEMSFCSSIVNCTSLQTNFQYPERDLLIKQSLVIRENLRRTSLRLLTYLKN